jgi:excisionase family DNA binding protein
MTARQAERAYSLSEAAELKSVSEKTLRRAIQSRGEAGDPTPLRAKRIGGRYRISASALEDWWEGLSEA